MQKKLLLANSLFHISSQDLPCLIHGNHGSGASLFSVSVVADLVGQGKKVLMISGYHMARDELLEQMKDSDSLVLIENEEQIQLAASKQIVCIKGEQPELFIKAYKQLEDHEERVLFIKNFELLESFLIAKMLDKKNLVLAGDLDAASSAHEILSKQWATKVYFSQTETDPKIVLPDIKQYHGYLVGDIRKGIVGLQF